MKLLLTLNGITNTELERAFSDLIENRSNLKIALIPTAADPIDWIKSELPGYDVVPKINESKLEQNLQWQEKWKAPNFILVASPSHPLLHPSVLR